MSLLIRVRKLDSKLCYNVVNKNISYNTTITHELYIFLELMFVLFPISYFIFYVVALVRDALLMFYY